ncbi:MAG: hypothetical protein M1820_009013 [Bogoriella megaspora]|nr:MAG: hypothetical protein M1820_009013 [Bogoriella megaspora]
MGILKALVDMGSNGIRLSISEVDGPHSRTLPSLYQHRIPISLYDAQYSTSGERVPIPASTINAILSNLLYFKNVCTDFSVKDPEDVRLLATEATRTAINSEDLRSQIKERTGWEVELLAKEDEGRIGAMGVAYSFTNVRGLMMDLGGGSTQLTWLISEDGNVEISPAGSVSMPYGAAALTRRLGEAAKSKNGKEELRKEIGKECRAAFDTIQLPTSLLHEAKERGLNLYLSGGGFRGWGYALMSTHPISPYPIPIINGFVVPHSAFTDTATLQAAVQTSQQDDSEGIFRISDRRASQIPATAFLVQCLTSALPIKINDVLFSQGGVREGALFESLTREQRAAHPLHIPSSRSTENPENIAFTLLTSATGGLPYPSPSTNSIPPRLPPLFSPSPLAHLLPPTPQSQPPTKETSASSALHSPTSGSLSTILPLTHLQRAILALTLCEKSGGFNALPPSDQSHYQRLQSLVDGETAWWCKYLGAIAALLQIVYPAGVRDDGEGAKRARFESRWDRDEKKGRWVLKLKIVFGDEMWRVAGEKAVAGVEKVGKKKNWIGGREGVGWEVRVDVGVEK